MNEGSGVSARTRAFRWIGVMLMIGGLSAMVAGCQDLGATSDVTPSTGTTMLGEAFASSTATTDDGAATGPGDGASGSGAVSDGDTGTDDAPGDLPSIYVGTLVAYTTTTERAPQVFTVNEDDDGQSKGMYVGDRLQVVLRPTSSGAVKDVLPQYPTNGVLRSTGQVREDLNADGNVFYFTHEWEAEEPGQATVQIWYIYGPSRNENVLTLYVHVVQ